MGKGLIVPAMSISKLYEINKDQTNLAREETKRFKNHDHGFQGILGEITAGCPFLGVDYAPKVDFNDHRGRDISANGLWFSCKTITTFGKNGEALRKNERVWLESPSKDSIKDFDKYILCIIHPDLENPEWAAVLDIQDKKVAEDAAEEGFGNRFLWLYSCYPELRKLTKS